MDERTQQLLEKLGVTSRDTTGAMQQLLSALSRTTSASNNQTNAATLTAQSLQQLQGSSNRFATVLSSTLSVGAGVVGSLTNLTSSIYGADKAFASVIPVLDSITTTFTKSVTAAGAALSGVSFAGFSFGKASEAAAAGVASTFEILSNAVKFQINGAQQVADQFLELSKVGATFGGSILAFSEAAVRAKMPLQEFSRFIIQNNEILSKLGNSIRKAAADSLALGRAIYQDNDVLVALYKNIEGLSQGAAEYLALQNQLGFQGKKTFESQRQSVEEYLIRQKELTAITGKSADTLRREEEGRRKQLDYNLKLGRLGDEARKNVQEGMAIAGKVFGDSGAKYAEEYFATGGKVFSAEAIAYASTNQEAADAIANLMSTVNSSREQYRKGYGQYFAANADTLEAAAKSNEDMAEILRASANPIIKGMAETGSAIMQSSRLMRNMTEMLDAIEEEGKLLRSGKLSDAATQAFVDAERARSVVQRKIDETVLENMKNIGSTIEFLNQMALSYIQSQKNINSLLEALKEAPMKAEAFNKAVGDMVDRVYERMKIILPNRPNGNTDPALPAPPVNPSGGAPPQEGNMGVQGSLPGGPTLAQASPSTPLTPSEIADRVLLMELLADSRSQKENQESSAESRNLVADITRLQTQIASLVTANNNNEQVVAALTDQNGLMSTLNDKMSEMIDSNRSIFNALA